MKKDTSKATLLVISTGFLALYFIFACDWAVIVSFALGITGIISVRLSKIIESLWFALANILSKIIPKILLGIVFYFLLFPLALVSRIFNKDPLMLSKSLDTYFIETNKNIDRKHFENPW